MFIIFTTSINVLLKIRGTTAPKSQGRLKGLLSDDSIGGLVVSKALSLNFNFSFLNRISLLLISSSYPVVITRLGGPRSRPYTSRKISRVQPGIEPGTSWMVVRHANHYTKQAVILLKNLILNSKTRDFQRISQANISRSASS